MSGSGAGRQLGMLDFKVKGSLTHIRRHYCDAVARSQRHPIRAPPCCPTITAIPVLMLEASATAPHAHGAPPCCER